MDEDKLRKRLVELDGTIERLDSRAHKCLALSLQLNEEAYLGLAKLYKEIVLLCRQEQLAIQALLGKE